MSPSHDPFATIRATFRVTAENFPRLICTRVIICDYRIYMPANVI